MGLIDGTWLYAADLATVPRTFATTADRDSYYVTNPTLKVAGARAYIGSGSAMAEYIYDGTAWKLVDTDGTFSGTVSSTGATGSVTIADGKVVATSTDVVNPIIKVTDGVEGIAFFPSTIKQFLSGFGGFSIDESNIELSHPSATYTPCGLHLKSGVPTLTGWGDLRLSAASTIHLDALTYIGNNVWAKPSTATASANAVWSSADADGYRRLNFNSSLRALKKCLLDLRIDPASVLNLKPRTWFDKGQIEDAGLDPETVTEADCLAAGLRRIPGFVAEEVEAVDPIFATYEGDDLQGVAYDRISAALLVLAKSQQQQIDTLTGRLADLETRLAKLGA